MVRLIEPVAPVDGRQSDMALFVARGTRRLLRAHGYASVTEVSLPNGRRADIVAVGADATILIVEVKSSVADFRADTKWPDYALYCDRLAFAIPDGIPPEIMPTTTGLFVADAYGAAVLREPPERRLSGAARRAMLVRFGQAAAHRLHGLFDPEAAGRDLFS